MSNSLKNYADRFNAQTLRERALIAGSILVALGFVWWSYFVDPHQAQIKSLNQDNQRVSREVNATRAQIQVIRQRIAGGVHKEKEAQLVQLVKELERVEEELRVKTVELVDPEKMFQLMNQLIYNDSRLQLLSLKRREVRPAIPPVEGEQEAESDPGIYRHVLEIEFAGKFLDIMRYMQEMEGLDWKLLWDEIDIQSAEHPRITVKVVISTLSTRKEWVGI
ncbi:MAG: hypothetical protein AAF353_19345 [Pseudomonadota bacterium]